MRYLKIQQKTKNWICDRCSHPPFERKCRKLAVGDKTTRGWTSKQKSICTYPSTYKSFLK